MLTHASICSLLKSLFLATLFCLAAIAQNPPTPQSKPTPPKDSPKGSKDTKDQDTVRIETELVQIDLIVTDKQGKPVHDLKREDFELYEDGKKQTLTHFAVGTAKQPARWLTTEKKRPATSPSSSAGEPATTTETPGRHIVLAVDDYHLSPGNLMFVKRALTKFITEQMVSDDQVAIVTTSGNVGLFQQFTSERDVLDRAINRLSVQEKVITDPSNIPYITEYQAELIEFGDKDALELAITDLVRREGLLQGGGGSEQGGGGGSPPRQSVTGARGGQSQASQGTSSGGAPTQRDSWEYRARTQARLVLAMSGNYTQATLDTLEDTIRNLRSLPGRKMMVLLSDGFFLSGTGVYSRRFDLRRITDAATRSGVVIYSIDARGLATLALGGDASERVELDVSMANAQSRIQLSALNAKRDGLYALATETGGTLFYNNNDLNLGLQRVLDANEAYYVLAYEPSESRRDGQFHKIEVRLPNHPDLKARTRHGYFSSDEKAEKAEKKAEEKRLEKLKSLPPDKQAQELKIEKDKQLAAGIGSLFPLPGIPVNLTVDFVDLATGSSALLNARIEIGNLRFEESKGRQQTNLDLAGYFFDERGKVAASFNERININIKPETLQALLQQGLTYRHLTQLKPGFYQARFAVREEKTGQLGSANGWIEIPDVKTNQLALSGILLSEPSQTPVQALPDSGAEPTSGVIPRLSSATRRFQSGGNMDLLLFVYNAKVESNAVDLVTQTYLFSGSKLIYASPLVKMAVAADSDLQRIPYAARVPLKGFPPGSYELRLTVIDRLTKATAYRRVNFTVE